MKTTFRHLLIRFTSMLAVAAIVPLATAQETATGKDPSLDDEINYAAMPQVENGRIVLPAMVAPSLATADIGNGRTPTGYRGLDSPTPTYPLPETGSQRAEVWNWTVSNWAAANTFSNPRYFEDRMLERHGHQRFSDHFQPVASGARFFATVPMLPYMMALRDPCDCEYTLGYYPSGSCTPAMIQRPPYERRALIMETAVVAGTVIAFP